MKMISIFCLLSSWTLASPFVMFTDGERQDILRAYSQVTGSEKTCNSLPLEKVVSAARGMYIYRDHLFEKKEINKLCQSIEDSKNEGQLPIVREDSLTVWGNQAAEQYGLEIRDILRLKEGDTLEVIFFDRNVGDYMEGARRGTRYDPRQRGLILGVYTHHKGLTGSLVMKYSSSPGDFEKFNTWTWEINAASATNNKLFWGPMGKHVNLYQLDPRTKIGWRGPAITLEASKNLPQTVIHYGTWYDDHMPFRTRNFLNINRLDF